MKKPTLIDNWKKGHRLISVQIALGGVLFWSAIGGLWTLWPVFADRIPIPVYICGGLALSIAVGVGRFLKQRGVGQ